MLGSVPRWPCGYIQRPYLLLRFLVLLSLSLSSSLFLLLSLLPPSSLLFLSRHAFDMRISKYTHASSAKRSPIWRTPFFFPPLPVSIFLLVCIVFRDSSSFALRGRPLWSLLSPKITIRSIQFDLLLRNYDNFFMKIFLPFKEDYSVEIFVPKVQEEVKGYYLNNFRNYYMLFNNLDLR